jgi:glucose/arabinose dehydrogenase
MRLPLLFAPALLALAASALAAPRHEEMDYGPFLSGTFTTAWPQDNTVLKGVAIRLDASAAKADKPEGPIGGGVYSIKPAKDVEGADVQDVYKSQRFKFGGYLLNVPNGSYKVTLKFADCWQTKPGIRVFDVLMQGQKVAEKLDLVDKAGHGKAYDVTSDNVQVADGQLRIEFNKHKGEPSIAAVIVEGQGFTRKINCGGPAVGEFAADWPINFQVSGQADAAGVVFDTELCRYAAWSTGGYLNLRGVVFDGGHGTNPSLAGEQQLGTRPLPGVASSDGKLDDPRAIPHGTLPRDWAKYKGLYRHEDGIVLSYSANGRDVLDMPGTELAGKSLVFTRTLNIAAGKPLTLVMADVEGAQATIDGDQRVLLTKDKFTTVIRTSGGKLRVLDGGRVVLDVASEASNVKLLLARVDSEAAKAIIASKLSAARDLKPLTKGGKPRWTETVTTQGQRADETKEMGAYVLDSLTLPETNPYKSWIRVGGFDFLPDGSAAISTWSGDVWICAGIDDKLQKLTWRRYAAGLFHALGLKVVDGTIFTHGRDQLTRLHDLNNDGEADFYECFNNDVTITPNFHEFAYELHTDPEGNFYFIKGGPVRPGGSGWDKIVPNHGCLMKVSKDGDKLEVVARGFRAPNGMGLGPHGELTSGDNEGTWTPAVPLNWIKPGGFYGVPDFAAKDPHPTLRENPLCWLPKEIDNSNGGQVWITGEKFGPLSGQLMHMSYGTCTLFSVLKEEVSGEVQGGVVAMPLKFDSGVCRARFRDKENALYLTGLRGWQTRAGKDGGFYRMRYTGKPYLLPTALQVKPDELQITFDVALDKEAAEDVDNYNVEQWNYRWTQSYGSPHFKISDPKQQGHDEVEIDEAKLSADGKTVTLKIADLAPVMQMKTRFTLKSAEGQEIKSEIHQTINVVGDQHGEVHPGEYKIVDK